MPTLKARPANSKLKRNDFATLQECEEEILNINRIKNDMIKENAERTALNNIIAALENYHSIVRHAHSFPTFYETLDARGLLGGYRYTEKKVDGFFILTPSGEKIKI